MATPSKREVLVVDDDPSIRDSIALVLVSAGYDVSSAQDGFTALLQLRRTLPDLIVSTSTCRRCQGTSYSPS